MYIYSVPPTKTKQRHHQAKDRAFSLNVPAHRLSRYFFPIYMSEECIIPVAPQTKRTLLNGPVKFSSTNTQQNLWRAEGLSNKSPCLQSLHSARDGANALYELCQSTSSQASEASAVMVPILRMREQRQTEVQWLKVTQLIDGGARILTQAVWLKASAVRDLPLALPELSVSSIIPDESEVLLPCQARVHPFPSTSLFHWFPMAVVLANT